MSEHTMGKLKPKRILTIYRDDSTSRRLVASWNLCDGIPTDQIEAAPNLGRLIVEHGEMLAALKGIRDNYDCECAQRCDGPHDDCPCSYCFGCRVIAKVEAPCHTT